MQCEDLYELISCLLPEVTASPAQHCTYSIFGTKLSRVRPSLFANIAALFFFLLQVRRMRRRLAEIFTGAGGGDIVVGIMLFGRVEERYKA